MLFWTPRRMYCLSSACQRAHPRPLHELAVRQCAHLSAAGARELAADLARRALGEQPAAAAPDEAVLSRHRAALARVVLEAMDSPPPPADVVSFLASCAPVDGLALVAPVAALGLPEVAVKFAATIGKVREVCGPCTHCPALG